KDSVQHDEEHPMLIKTTAARYAALEAAIRAAHPDELPEIIAVPIGPGLPSYLDWVSAETSSPLVSDSFLPADFLRHRRRARGWHRQLARAGEGVSHVGARARH